jgi:hypothetical protein
MRTRPALLTLLSVPPALLLACTGDLGDVGSSSNPDGTLDDSKAALCAEAPVDVGHAPLRRLTQPEYKNTIFALLDVDTSALPVTFDPDGETAGFVTNNNDYVTEYQLEAYMEAAEIYASAIVERGLDTVPGVELDCETGELDCLASFVEQFGRRAFRRPLTPEESARYTDLFESANSQWDTATAHALVLQAFLQSPHFLYLPEVGGDAVEGASELVELGPYELASRLSYFLWKTMPDDDLLTAAETGELSTPEGLEAQTLRMLEDDRARATVASFHAQWLHIADLEELPKDAELHPEWSPEIGVLLREETLGVANDVILGEGDGRLATLLTTRQSRIGSELEAYYDVTAGDDGLVELAANQRAGILTHASVMAALGHSNHTSWTKRGHFIREDVLCEALALPNGDVDMTVLNDPDRLVNPECKGCHLLMDPIGAAFETYDTAGQFLATPPPIPEGPLMPFRIEQGSKEIDVAGEFSDPIELAERLSTSRTVADCVTTKWYTFATYRSEQEEDSCAVVKLQQRFADSDFDVRDLIAGIAQSDSFRLQRIPAEGK